MIVDSLKYVEVFKITATYPNGKTDTYVNTR